LQLFILINFVVKVAGLGRFKMRCVTSLTEVTTDTSDLR